MCCEFLTVHTQCIADTSYNNVVKSFDVSILNQTYHPHIEIELCVGNE